ncbi:uncharacterized protein LOC123194951 [Mangifera indica]|uniref:uncharacterized protein LOC123194951 n=1 Tax=Mangifera indica TaxID=29780 RepID=UPI001CFB72EF|nr:uncharacterized protein LOC123194951 [Mangifera indica]
MSPDTSRQMRYLVTAYRIISDFLYIDSGDEFWFKVSGLSFSQQTDVSSYIPRSSGHRIKDTYFHDCPKGSRQDGAPVDPSVTSPIRSEGLHHEGQPIGSPIALDRPLELVRTARGRIVRKGPLVRTPYINPFRGRAKRVTAFDTHDVYFIGSKSKDSFWRLVVELHEWLTDDVSGVEIRGSDNKCLALDVKLGIWAPVLHLLWYFFYTIIITFIQHPHGRVDASKWGIKKIGLSLYLDLPIPLPLLVVRTSMRDLKFWCLIKLVKAFVFLRCLTRASRIYKKATVILSELTESTWHKAISIFLLYIYMLAAHLYLMSNVGISKEMRLETLKMRDLVLLQKLPKNLQQQVRKYQQSIWQKNKDDGVEFLFSNLPNTLLRNIKRELCLELLKKVQEFKMLNKERLDALCDNVKPVLYSQHTCIFQEGYPIGQMLFVVCGKLSSYTSKGITGFVSTDHSRDDDNNISKKDDLVDCDFYGFINKYPLIKNIY